MRLGHIGAVLVARNREFLRDRGSLAWNLIFPVMMVLGFALLFSDEKLDLYKVAVLGPSDAVLLDLDYIDPIAVDDLSEAIVKVERHQIDLLLDTQTHRYWVNTDSPKGYLLANVLAGTDPDRFDRVAVDGSQVRYVDWVVPGVLATNMMFSALFGVGYVIVRYRRAGVLRRLKATPLTPFEFLSAQVASRLWIIVGLGVLVYWGTDSIVHFTMRGSYWDLLVVFALGAASLIGLGLVIATRTSSQELAGGLLNMISWPMMLLSSAWFSLEGAPQWVQSIALVFPLTHLIAAARAIMIDGANLMMLWPHLLALAVMLALCLLVASLLFRWE